MSAPASDLITVNIDGQDVQVPKGINMIEAAAMAGVEVPHYCYHPKLSVVGNCRMCLVEMGMPMRNRETGETELDENGKPKIGWMPRPAIACATTASPGLHIRTKTESVKTMREGVMEFLLVNHPLDCPICDQAGECRLQEFATDYGRGYSRFVENKNVKPKRTVLGPRVMLDDERCILCSRCIRFSKEIAKDDVLGFIDRGSYSTLTCYPGKSLENNYSLNTVDICPVGALTSRDFRFKMRVWFLKETPSICTESSVGVNTEIGSREGKIYRITPRRNDAVNDTWMADSGRELYKLVDAENRLSEVKLDGVVAPLNTALQAAARMIKDRKLVVVASGRSSVEEQFLLKKLVEEVNPEAVFAVSHVSEGDGLLISADRAPNVRGLLVTGLLDELPEARLEALGRLIDEGKVDTVFSDGEDLLAAGLTEDQLKKVDVIYVGTHANATSALAQVVLPAATVFEKQGTFVNQQFRIQKFSAAVPVASGAKDNLEIYSSLIQRVTGQSEVPVDIHQVWNWIADTTESLKDLSWKKIPAAGTLLDASAYSHLPFAEGETLHYKPATEAVVAQA